MSSNKQRQADQVFEQIGRMTRDLHNSLAALGHDKSIAKTASSIPDARERLAYVMTLTEQAASKVLNAVDLITPVQEQARSEARALAEAWDRAATTKPDSADYQATVQRTRDFLQQVDQGVDVTKVQLMEIVMTQEFQDLTGQVIKKIADLAQEMETQLLSLLAATAQPGSSPEGTKGGLLNGPAMESGKLSKQAVTSQEEADKFLESLGF